jgi:rhodanese-related sulfurtransferase
MRNPVPSVEVEDVPLEAAPQLLDVREDEEWQAGHIEAAVHVPMNQLPNKLHYEPQTVRRDEPVVVVCRSGSRSAHVTAWLVQQGFDARNLAGGMHAWASAGRPMRSSDGRPPEVV